MTDLLDLSPVGEEVEIDGKKLLVRGLSLTEIVRLIGRFPHLKGLFDGVVPEWDQLFAMLGDAVGPIIAAGFGKMGDADYERAAAELPMERAVIILMAMKRQTMPGGVGPFVASLRGLVQQGAAEDSSPSKEDKSSSSRKSPGQSAA